MTRDDNQKNEHLHIQSKADCNTVIMKGTIICAHNPFKVALIQTFTPFLEALTTNTQCSENITLDMNISEEKPSKVV